MDRLSGRTRLLGPQWVPLLLLALACLVPPAWPGLDLNLNEAPADEGGDGERQELVASGRWWLWAAGGLSKLPDYFDFEGFRKRFKRSYSADEYLYRKSVFFKRCLQVFTSRVANRLGRHLSPLARKWWPANKAGDQQAPEAPTYVQGITMLADRSPNEIKRMFMRAPPIEFRPRGQTEADYYAELERKSAELEEPTWETELASRATSADEEEPAQGLSLAELAERPVFSEREARRSIELALAGSGHNPQLEGAIWEELLAEEDSVSRASLADLSGDEEAPLPWPGSLLNGSIRAACRPDDDDGGLPDLNSGPPEADICLEWPEPGEHSYVAPQLTGADELGIDWSVHKCFHSVYDQGEGCGKCYVMATTALAEFYKCTERVGVIEMKKFDKDYVLYCGQKYSPSLMGCTGGSLYDSLRFIAEAGLNTIRGWKARRAHERVRLRKLGSAPEGLDFKCPLSRYDPETPLEGWGDERVRLEPEVVSANEWLVALRDGPLVASVQMPAEGLELYRGGVHSGAGCRESGNWHAMLLVGFGRHQPSGTPFWRFRNSWGAEWGEQGHFNLAMSVPGECLSGGVRVFWKK